MRDYRDRTSKPEGVGVSSFSKSSTLPMTSRPASRRFGVLLFLRTARGEAGGGGLGGGSSIRSSEERIGVGARISGVGPEKSLPVMRDNVAISDVRSTSSYKGRPKSVPYGVRLLRQYVMRAGFFLSSVLNLFLHAFLSRPGSTYDISS